MGIFMARGYKHDPFHRHVARSLANYFGDQRVADLKTAVEASEIDREDELLDILENNTVTAWGAKSGKAHDLDLFKQMAPGDHFIMRTGQPNVVRYIQQVDCLLGEDVPAEFRQQLSDIIWTSPDYDLIWLSKTPITEIELPEEEFENVIHAAQPDFEIADWFPSQGRNFTRIDENIIAHFGGEKEFLDRLAEWDGERRKPGVSNYFLLNATETPIDISQSHQYDFKQTDTDLASEILAAENDARLIIHNEESIISTGRLGNIEGERRDDGIYKILNIIDWEAIDPIALSDAVEESSVQPNPPLQQLGVGSSAAVMDLPNVTQADADLWKFVQTATEDNPSPSPDTSLYCNDPVSPTAPYYWVNHNSFDELEDEYLQAKNDDRWMHDIAKLDSGDVVFNYHGGELVGYSEVVGSPFPITSQEETHCKVNISLTRFDEPIPLPSVLGGLLDESRQTEDYYPVTVDGVRQGYLTNLSKEAGEYLLQEAGLSEESTDQVNPERLEERLELPRIAVDLPDELYFQSGKRARLRQQINAAVNSGKHIVFTGPPGTGKSRLARAVSEQATDFDSVDGYTFTTATAEWTTFDTIGGNVPEVDEEGRERLAFDPRLFLRSFRDEDEQIHNEWLIIDELNRADIDKAFGQLFSVLSHDSVALPYERSERVQISWVDETTPPEERSAIASSPDQFPVTPAWRMIGTMNTMDKTSLYELSYAFMRRFSFIHVGVPDLTDDDGVVSTQLLDPTGGQSYGTVWRSEYPELESTIEDYHEEVAVIWQRINDHRAIGPAIVLDVFQHIAAFKGGDRDAPLSSAVVSLIYPQLEGMREAEYEGLLEELADEGEVQGPGENETETVNLPLDMQYLRSKAADMFDIDV